MKEITLEELLEAGCHFGHQVSRQNPKARDFVFESRDNIHIIDLAKTKEGLDEAAAYVKQLAASGGTLVIVGAKRQARPVVEEEIKRAYNELSSVTQAGQNAGIYAVTNRWIGGTFTNFSEVSKNYKKLKDLSYRLQSDEEKVSYTKKEVSQWEKEKNKLENYYGGLAEMTQVPTALFVIDTHMENISVDEARSMNVTTVGIVDTNADPELIDYPIPANDDAVGSIQLILHHVVDAWIEGKKAQSSKKKEEAAAKLKAEEVAKQPVEKVGKVREVGKGETEKPKKAKKISSKETEETQETKAPEGATTEPEKKKRGRKPKTA